MLNDTIRRAFEAKVADLNQGGPSLAPILDAIASHGEGILASYAAYTPEPPTEWQRDEWRRQLGLGETWLERVALEAYADARVPNLKSNLTIAVLFARVGFISPEASLAVYDAFARGWLHGKANLTTPLELAVSTQANRLLDSPGTLPVGLSEMFWTVVGNEVDPASITPTIAAFGGTYDETLKAACARAILIHEGQPEVAAQPWLPRVVIDDLSVHPKGTLGYEYYHLIVDNGFDPEVLDPEQVTGFHAGLDGTNRRILQTHEIWHLVAGYSTSPLHETAISSFQLAQFGHNYSAIFLATVVTLLTFEQPMFCDIILQVIAEAWQHGRSTRPLMLIDWFSLWGQPIEALRRDYGIRPFESIVSDLMTPP